MTLAAEPRRHFSIDEYPRYLRRPEGWLIMSYVGREAVAQVRSVGVSVGLGELYAGVVWTPEGERGEGPEVREGR